MNSDISLQSTARVTPSVPLLSPEAHSIAEFLELIHQIKSSHGATVGLLTLESLILTHGFHFSAPLREAVSRGQPRECYRNATLLALTERRLVYCEGYAVSRGVPFPVEHAWCVDEYRQVIDPTWRDGCAYFGVSLRQDFVLATMNRTERYGILDNWQEGWPILRTAPFDFLHPLG